MLKLIPIPNPFSLAFSSYKMTDLGKVLVGSMIAEAALSAYQGNQTQTDPVQETWTLYGSILQIINKKPDLIGWWNNISVDSKRNAIIELFCKEGKGHLVPYLQRYVFPTIR